MNKILKTNVRTEGQSLNKKAFTLIELLAVLVILAIIALIAVPQILNIINDSKIKSEKISVENYLRAVDISIINKDMDSDTRVLDGWYSIIDGGKKLEHQEYPERTLDVQYEGQGLPSGDVEIKDNKVVSTLIITDNLTITKNNGGKLNFYKTNQIEKSILISGSKFNATLKNLVNKRTDMKDNTEDTSIISIEFYSNGILPSGYTKDSLSLLPHISVSDKNDIIAYNDNGKVYIVSDNLINFNQNSSYMFYRFKGLTQINFININTSDVTNMTQMFSESNKIANLNLNKFDTSKVTTMDYMFRWCGNLTALDLSNFRTEKVISMKEMFNGCSSLISLDLSNFNTSNITDMFNMFINCSSLTSLDLSSFDTSKVTGMGYMFSGCISLTSLDVSKWDTSKVTNTDHMFNSVKLTTIDLSGWDTNSVTTMDSMFRRTSNLTNIKIGCNWKTAEDTTDMFTTSNYTLDKLNTLVEQTQATCTTS